MSHTIIKGFHFADWDEIEGPQSGELTAAEKYQKLVKWAGQARGRNPGAFDALTEWLLDDSEWGGERLAENEQILIYGVFARFKGQNAKLRAYLKELEPSGAVNTPVFAALDRFDDALAGALHDSRLREAAEKVFADFSAMRARGVREIMAGNKTGPAGTESVEIFGYINFLKDCDAQVQWCLFMPDMVKAQQNGFKVDNFEYKKMPAMRFIGKECTENGDADMSRELDIMRTLDSMPEYKSGLDYDVLFMHHYGRGVDVERWHGFWGRFMKAGAPVPDGFRYWDFVPDDSGAPYLTFRSQFAFAAFSGDIDAMHKREGFDSDAMYDVTRNIILGQGVCIPYPELYWTAEVFPDGCGKPSTAYMFSVLF